MLGSLKASKQRLPPFLNAASATLYPESLAARRLGADDSFSR